MSINTLFFAHLAEQAGTDIVQLEFVAGLTARDLIDKLDGKVPDETIAALRHDAVLLSVNKQLADWDTPLCDGDEVGFLPPFSGG